jgi:DNA polymerase
MTSWSSTLSIDIETYSSLDLTKSGVYRYAASPDFEILLISYAVDEGSVVTLDLSGTAKPVHGIKELKGLLADPAVRKTAFNATFEITCLRAAFGDDATSPEQWDDTMARAQMLGLPYSLAECAKACGTKMKDGAGTLFISYFCKPCKPTKSNGGRTRNLPENAPDRWAQFIEYNRQDVEAERALRVHLEKLGHVPDSERRLRLLDYRINSCGIAVDADVVDAAIECAAQETATLTHRAREITGLENPNSVEQLKGWLSGRGYEFPSLTKSVLAEAGDVDDPQVREVLSLRARMSRTSVKKYQAIAACTGEDCRARGLLMYYGASRTGRWTGRLVQVHNLPQNHLPDLDLARTLLKERKYEELDFMFGDVQDTLSQLVRTAFVAPAGKTFVIADFSAIEARILAWLADEKWRMDVFAGDGRIYEASAAKMFKVPIETITKGSPLRQKGKIAELALGYGGSVGALEQMGALGMGLKPTELKPLVDKWRAANRKITELWKRIGGAAIEAVRDRRPRFVLRTGPGSHTLILDVRQGILRVVLPSLRELAYVSPKIETGKFGGDALTYMGLAQTTRKWQRIETYGPKLVENIVQAVARDCLAKALMRLSDAGYRIVMHVHDEVVIEADTDCTEDVCRIMDEDISWAPGLRLKVDGYATAYYKKD